MTRGLLRRQLLGVWGERAGPPYQSLTLFRLNQLKQSEIQFIILNETTGSFISISIDGPNKVSLYDNEDWVDHDTIEIRKQLA